MDVLINLNSMVPDISDNLIKRKRLFDLIDAGANKKGNFLLVSAPAGYGKTTLISAWLREQQYSAAWFTAGEHIDHPSSFFPGIITALQKINSDLFKGTENILKMPVLPGVESVVSSFIDEMRFIEEKIVLVLDNFQLIKSKYNKNIIEKLIQFLPENLFLIILTREDPPFMLNRFRIEGSMSEIRAQDLRFSKEEMLLLFNQVMSLDMDNTDLDAIYKKTEGWVSGARLVGIKLMGKSRQDIHDFVLDLSGSHHFIIDYLVEEVLRDLDEVTKEFLYRTSVVERFCPELCNILTGRDDSSKILNKLEIMNLFLLPLDDKREWFRYHQLFRDSLQINLTQSEKNELHMKAADWFAEQKLFVEAVEEARKAGEFTKAARYLLEMVPEYLERGDLKKILELLEEVPDNYLKDRPLLLIMKAWSLFATGNKKDALFYIDLITRNSGLIDNCNKGRLMTLTSLISGDIEEAKQALKLIDEKDKIFRVNALMTLGQIQAGYGKLMESVDSFQQAYYLGRETGQVFMEIMSLINLALKQNQLGELQEALTLCRQNIERFQDSRGYIQPLARLIFIPLGILHYYKGDYQKAKKYLIEGIELSECLSLVHVSWMPKIYYALSCYEAGETEQAQEIIDELIDFTRKYNLKPNYQWADNIKVEFSLKAGNLEMGREKLEFYSEACKQNFNTITIQTILTYCRVLLRKKEYSEAISQLKKVFDQSSDYLDKLSAGLLLALAYYNCNEKEKAENYLVEAMKMSVSQGYISPFVREGKSILSLLKEFRELSPEMIDKIVSKIKVNLEEKGETEELVEPLTEREREILTLAAGGLSNKKIAEKLFITEGTTKWHLSNIYSKLGVSNRTRAAAKARELGLLE